MPKYHVTLHFEPHTVEVEARSGPEAVNMALETVESAEDHGIAVSHWDIVNIEASAEVSE
jgi:hypothetical protein